MSREKHELRAMKMEMLRMRGELQRAEMVSALGDMRSSTRTGRGLLRTVGGLGTGMVARRGWIGLAASLLRRPWAAAAGLAALRSVKRHPVMAVGVVALAATAFGLSRHARTVAARRHAPGEDVFSAPSG